MEVSMEEVVIRAIQPYDLHGVRWYRIAYSPVAAPETLYETRFSFDVIYPDPQAGDRVRIRKLLGVVDRIEKVTDA
jgi:hypothetical protein